MTKSYFRRTVQQQEIDYVEEDAGKIRGYQIKWSTKAKTKTSKLFTETYKTETIVLNHENFRGFL